MTGVTSYVLHILISNFHRDVNSKIVVDQTSEYEDSKLIAENNYSNVRETLQLA
jgi:hypothetical protein